MQAVDLKGKLNKYLLDKCRKIDDNILNDICQYKQKDACRYMCLIAQGFVCAKKTPLKSILDDRVEKEQMNAKGDNCKGLGKNI